jgi:hypothetical protein
MGGGGNKNNKSRMRKVENFVDKANVIAQPSCIPNGGTGLFATVQIPKGSRICTYAGRLYDAREAMYRDPTYMVNFELGKGFKLDGDGADGDIGHFANASQVNDGGESFPPVNARFCLKSKRQWSVSDNETGDIYFRGRFELVARNTIEAGEEIILDYGKGYWRTMTNYWQNGTPPRSDIAVARDMRAKRRLERFRSNIKTSTTAAERDDINVANIATTRRKRAREDNFESPIEMKSTKKNVVTAGTSVRRSIPRAAKAEVRKTIRPSSGRSVLVETTSKNKSTKEIISSKETRPVKGVIAKKQRSISNDASRRSRSRSRENIPKPPFQLKRRRITAASDKVSDTTSSTLVISAPKPHSRSITVGNGVSIEVKAK